jgi:hypothetical protein
MPVGTVVKVEGESKEISEMCMIIWCRGINSSSMKSWDYVSIYYSGDFKIKPPNYRSDLNVRKL